MGLRVTMDIVEITEAVTEWLRVRHLRPKGTLQVTYSPASRPGDVGETTAEVEVEPVVGREGGG